MRVSQWEKEEQNSAKRWKRRIECDRESGSRNRESERVRKEGESG